MARKSKSSKNNKKSNTSNKNISTENDPADVQVGGESLDAEAPVVIEDDSTDVTPSDEISPEDETQIPEELSDDVAADAEDVIAEAEIIQDGENIDLPEAEAAVEEDTAEPKPEEAEPIAEPVADDVTDDVAAAPPPPPEPQKASSVPLFIGGAVAAGLGYLAAMFTQAPVDTSALTDSITSNVAQIETLTSDVATLQGAEAPAVDLSPIEGTLGDLATQFDGLTGDLDAVRGDMTAALDRLDETANALSDRITVLETAGPGESEAAQATEQDLAAFRAELQRISDEAEARVASSMDRASEIEQAAIANAAAAQEAAKLAEQEAAEAAATAERETAIAAVVTALESGQGYGDALTVLGDVPDVLAENAEDGVTTVVELQQTFADAARNALSQAETVPQDASAGDRLVAFFNQQTNARSLSPKEGNTTDAILSRGEAMMKQGDVAAALTELEALGEAPKAAMQAWFDQATTRQAALDAAAQLNPTN